MSSQVGTLLSGRYRLDARIGAGGMSTVYRAFDTVLERQVAIKLMHREIAADADQLERFRREARAVAQLNHPHVVGVIDAGEAPAPEEQTGFGEPAAMPYIVFEYVEGETLKNRIRRMGRLPVDEAIAYAIEIARALCAAHSRGIVHRDIKPQNVLIDEEGSAKVTDFGIARSLDEEGLTAEGRVLGTTDYVSPEQALGHDVNPQSDIYSLGIVLYEMLTGDVPFHGENQVAVAMKHVREDLPDVQRRRADVSASLAAILDRMTAKDLRKRYTDALTLEADLEEALTRELNRTGHSTGEATAVLRTLPERSRRRLPLRMRRRRLPIIAVIALLLAGGALAVVLLREGVNRTQRGTGTGTVKPPKGAQVVSVKRTSASDFDPLGDDDEHHDERGLAVDKDPGTAWSTEGYTGDTLGKDGVGLYVDADPGVDARSIEVDTPETGWKAEIRVADGKSPPDDVADWDRVAGGSIKSKKQRFKLQGDRHRYYLVWITDLTEGSERVKISEITLFAPRT